GSLPRRRGPALAGTCASSMPPLAARPLPRRPCGLDSNAPTELAVMDSKTDKASPFSSLLCLIAALLWAGLALAELPGPRDGPSALPTKQVIYIASDFQNGGVSGVYRGFERAARLIGWQVSALNGQGSPEQLRNALREAIAL